MKISPYESPPYESPPCENCPPEICPRKNCPYENSPPEKITLHEIPSPIINHTNVRKDKNYKISCLEENCTQHNILIKITKVVFDTQMISQKIFELRYFLYRMKKIQKLNESENRQMAFTCQLYKSRRTKTRQSNYKI